MNNYFLPALFISGLTLYFLLRILKLFLNIPIRITTYILAFLSASTIIILFPKFYFSLGILPAIIFFILLTFFAGFVIVYLEKEKIYYKQKIIWPNKFLRKEEILEKRIEKKIKEPILPNDSDLILDEIELSEESFLDKKETFIREKKEKDKKWLFNQYFLYHAQLAFDFKERGDLEGARLEIKKALEVAPKREETLNLYFELVSILKSQGKIKEAKDEITKAFIFNSSLEDNKEREKEILAGLEYLNKILESSVIEETA